MKCPKCKSDNVMIQMMETGSKTKKTGNGFGGIAHNTVRAGLAISTLGLSNLVVPKAKGKEKTKTKMQKIALCQECGHSWNIK